MPVLSRIPVYVCIVYGCCTMYISWNFIFKHVMRSTFYLESNDGHPNIHAASNINGLRFVEQMRDGMHTYLSLTEYKGDPSATCHSRTRTHSLGDSTAPRIQCTVDKNSVDCFPFTRDILLCLTPNVSIERMRVRQCWVKAQFISWLNDWTIFIRTNLLFLERLKTISAMTCSIRHTHTRTHYYDNWVLG